MIQFRIQSTPNPRARKYVLDRTVKAEGKISYQRVEECEHVPLAAALLSVPAISQVHLFANVLTITQDGSLDWGNLDHIVQNLVNEKIQEHDINFPDHPDKPKTDKAALTPDLAKIDEILDRTIRPGLQMDGGDVEPVELVDNILTVRYMGACGGCPSAMLGTLEAIKDILREEFHAELEVVAL
jgi:NFU1 iron-sulfur cluster scaffold homolog, mitochondrial